MTLFVFGCGNDINRLRNNIIDLQSQIHELEASLQGGQGEQGLPGDNGMGDQDGDESGECVKEKVCHDGQTLNVCEEAKAAHLEHGDVLGECVVAP